MVVAEVAAVEEHIVLLGVVAAAVEEEHLNVLWGLGVEAVLVE